MKHTFRQFFIVVLPLLIFGALADDLPAADWSIPLAGNAFRTAPTAGREGFRRDGALVWGDPEGVFSTFFHIDRPADLDLTIRARADAGNSILITRVGDRSFDTVIEDPNLSACKIGRVHIPTAGYVRVDFQGKTRAEKVYGEFLDLLVSSDTEGLELDYVKTNKGNMYYWGRRGPSVHLRYEVPRNRELRYAYSEITVPPGQDPIGSYFMANGFGEGYFGIQVNGAKERRVLFSVWSPFKTDNPSDIPQDQRIVALAKGPEVRIGEFGNEGSGGQSFLVYPWQAGVTYRFLTEVSPDGQGNTVYTSWFGDKSDGRWRLIASFRRPKTSTHLRGFHSFLENFDPSHGHVMRSAFHGNVWVRDIGGQWHECTTARFSVDATGGGGHRLDFSGGSKDARFFLRNGGFFNESGRPGESFTRDSSGNEPPTIEFDALPRR